MPSIELQIGQVSTTSPVESRDTQDPGDVVLNRFRYQFAYGIVLLVGMGTGKFQYRAIWCEQHEDFLAEYCDGTFDVYQVKTRASELGPWEVNDEAFWKSVERFVEHDNAFSGKIREFKFVSNCDFSRAESQQRGHLNIVNLLVATKKVKTWSQLPDSAKKGFEVLAEKLNTKTDAERDALFKTLGRVAVVLGPTERGFEDEIAQSHLSQLDLCSHLNATSLKRVVGGLITAIHQASSLVTANPARHYVALGDSAGKDPLLAEKRLTREDLILIVDQARQNYPLYPASLGSLVLGKGESKSGILQKKMKRGGLEHYFEMMRRRMLYSEAAMLDLASRPENGAQMISQLENTVLGICDDLHLRMSQCSEPYGKEMLIGVQDQLKSIAECEPLSVFRQPRDVLVGLAALLTAECKVWWSNQFDIGDPS
jgi:hypothetical protein